MGLYLFRLTICIWSDVIAYCTLIEEFNDINRQIVSLNMFRESMLYILIVEKQLFFRLSGIMPLLINDMYVCLDIIAALIHNRVVRRHSCFGSTDQHYVIYINKCQYIEF